MALSPQVRRSIFSLRLPARGGLYTGREAGAFSMAFGRVAAVVLRPFALLGEGLAKAPWIGWAAWIVFCISILVQTGPRRFGSTFGVYLDFASRYWSMQPLYDATTLDGFNYWPASLLLYVPVLKLDPTLAGMIVIAIFGALFTYACYRIVDAVMPQDARPISAFDVTGLLLLINIPAAWFNFKYIQAQTPMTAAMLLGATAMIGRRFRPAALWIFFAAVAKPLAVVMLLLCAALQPRMRWWLAGGLVFGLLLPFVFVDPAYLSDQYKVWVAKLTHMANVWPNNWPFQADFQTMLDSAGIVVAPQVATGVRVVAALGTLALASRLTGTGNRLVFPLGVLLLSGCYITLFGPRNEFTSFLVVTPTMTLLALLLFGRNLADPRGWGLIFAVMILGFAWEFHYGRWVKPLVITLTYVWMVWLTLDVRRWIEIVGGDGPAPGGGRPGR
ncbi:MAG: hypothetical protein DPW22_04795 [Alphaproteobacteria bacterium]|nr:hypothetical protein [Alphaproteobacteria bacterium]